LADVAIIGKSFLARGGQNPVEAIAAKVPVVVGPDMTNFADLVTLLRQDKAIWRCASDKLADTLNKILSNSKERAARTERAYAALKSHSGATQRSVEPVHSYFES
jgi:3-deoxy-D-manno-octulosonic-acid transferase